MKLLKKIKSLLKYLFTEPKNTGTSEESLFGFDMYNITEWDSNKP